MSFKRILLVKPSGRRGLSFAYDLIPIGLEYIAAYIEDAVNEVHIVDLEMEKRSFQQLVNFYHPDLVGITLSATEHNSALDLAEIAKKNGITTVVGGYHPTAVPDLMLSYPQLDLVVRGEGEITMKELVEKGSPEGILGLSYKKDGKIIHNKDRHKIEDLDAIPFPARHLRQYSYKAGDGITDFDVLVTSRGCNGQCSFCCEPSMSQSYLRWRSPENVVEEILEVAKYHEGRRLRVIFADPNFMGNPKRVGHLCDLLQKHDLNIDFLAMVRTDNMAKNSEVVKKMCEARINSFEMGIESPNPKDLKSTRKGITTKIHRDAVRNIRENGGRPGGTFVIGLPDQTEEEIKAFPAYARDIGLTAAAFGIATPFPGTEFYKELDKQGLIFETDWDNFDEMHSVYRTKHISKERLEELATYCMAKFWNIDTFIDREKVSQKRTRRKTPLIDFVLERAVNVRFMNDNGITLQKSNFGQHIKTFLKAYADPRVESYTRKVGVHNVLEMSKFLRILGHQKIQFTFSLDDATVSFVFKTTKNAVEYIQVMQKRQHDTTIDFNINLKLLNESSQLNMIRSLFALIQHDLSIKRLWNTFRLFMAVGTEALTYKVTRI